MGFERTCWICGDPACKIYSEYVDAVFVGAREPRFLEKKEILTLSEEEIRKKIRENSIFSVPRMYCEECYKKEKETLLKKQQEYGRLRKELMLERALRIMEKQRLNMYDYKEIISELKEYILENPEKFDSSHEMVAAIVLVDNEIKCKMQHKIGRYRVDFFIPDLKIILEIDGVLHKATLFKDNERDRKLREMLGKDWETVRISTEYLEENAELLVEAIKEVKRKKQEIRKENFGVLPEWYSKREKARKPRAIKTGDDSLILD